MTTGKKELRPFLMLSDSRERKIHHICVLIVADDIMALAGFVHNILIPTFLLALFFLLFLKKKQEKEEEKYLLNFYLDVTRCPSPWCSSLLTVKVATVVLSAQRQNTL